MLDGTLTATAAIQLLLHCSDHLPCCCTSLLPAAVAACVSLLPLCSCAFRQRFDDVTAAGRVSEVLAHPVFMRAAGPALHSLAGAPATLHSGAQALHPFPLGAYPGLTALQLYVPPHQQAGLLRMLQGRMPTPAWQTLGWERWFGSAWLGAL